MTFNRRVIVIHRYLSNAYNRFNGKVSDISPYLRTSSRYNHPASIRFLSDQIQDKKTLQQKDDPIDSNEMAHPKSVSNVITEVDISTFTIEVPIRLPDLGESRGKVIKWHKKEGDIIRPGDTLCDVETELFTFGMDIDDECLGILGTIIAQTDEKLMPDALLCIVLHQPEN